MTSKHLEAFAIAIGRQWKRESASAAWHTLQVVIPLAKHFNAGFDEQRFRDAVYAEYDRSE